MLHKYLFLPFALSFPLYTNPVGHCLLLKKTRENGSDDAHVLFSSTLKSIMTIYLDLWVKQCVFSAIGETTIVTIDFTFSILLILAAGIL